MDEILDPQKMYDLQIKEQYKNTATEYFDELVKKSSINVEANRVSVKKYDETMALVNHQSGKYKSVLFLKGLVIFFIICFLIAVFIGVSMFFTKNNIHIGIKLGLVIGGIVVVAALIILLVKVINKRAKERKAVLDGLNADAKKLLDECYTQMAPLNTLFDWSAPSVISKKATPLIQLDPIFDNEKYGYLYEKFKFAHSPKNNTSIVGVVSGSIMGNPFLLYRSYNQKIVMKTYTGSIVIHWTERVTDAQGHSRNVTRSQTLTASVQKPAPSYYYDTELVYGNEAAPLLHFTRKPSNATDLSEREVERVVKKGTKALNKKVKKDMTDDDPNTNFTAMTNTKFDVLFGALDRDNEAQFRLLFTPLAQNSMVRLIEDAKPYGDDFYYVKDGPLNYISSVHSQTQDYTANPELYASHSVDISKNLFVNYNCQFLEALFFDLAPLLCIPLYQQQKPIEYIYGDIFKTNYTPFEAESVANSLNSDCFKPDYAITSQILKATTTKRVGKSDITTITSHAFKGIDHTDLISVIGGDGHMHTVPVTWTEYIPVSKNTPIAVRNTNASRNTYFSKYTTDNKLKDFINSHSKSTTFQKGIIGMVLLSSYVDKDDLLFDSLF